MSDNSAEPTNMSYDGRTPSESWSDMSYAQRRTDAGNALVFAIQHANYARYARDAKEWVAWNGARWSRGDDAEVIACALITARGLADLPRDMFGTGASFPDEERQRFLMWAAKSLSAERINAIPRLAKADPSLACTLADFDRDPMLLNCPNGTVVLSTGAMRDHRQTDLITKTTSVPYDPNATCPSFLRFLDEITERSEPLKHFLHLLLGYAITGSVVEEVLPIFYGSGGNGKSKLVEAVFAVLGDYAVKANSDLLVKTKSDKHADMLMHLIGSRFAIATESAQGAHLDERIVKELTGGDTVNARVLYQGSRDYKPTWKLLWRTNDLPDVDRYDDAIRRRLRVVPFTASFTGRENRNLDAELAAEAEGILAWLVQGARLWHTALTAPGSTTGLPFCAEVDAQTHEYEADNDRVSDFLDTWCHSGQTERGRLWSAYCDYLLANPMQANDPLKNPRQFYAALRAKNIEECRVGTGRCFQIGLKDQS